MFNIVIIYQIIFITLIRDRIWEAVSILINDLSLIGHGLTRNVAT